MQNHISMQPICAPVWHEVPALADVIVPIGSIPQSHISIHAAAHLYGMKSLPLLTSSSLLGANAQSHQHASSCAPVWHEVPALADVIVPQHHNVAGRKAQLGGEQVVQAVHVIAWAAQLRAGALVGAAAAAGQGSAAAQGCLMGN
jgi:hypothetical protein